MATVPSWRSSCKGSGLVDMNETIGAVRIVNDTGSIIYPPSRPFFEIAQYLSERSFAVLQYIKRGIGESYKILDSSVWGNATVHDLQQDAEKALDVLIQQPEVDANHTTLVGHSEGTTIVPRVAIDNPVSSSSVCFTCCIDTIMWILQSNRSLSFSFQLILLPKPLHYGRSLI